MSKKPPLKDPPKATTAFVGLLTGVVLGMQFSPLLPRFGAEPAATPSPTSKLPYPVMTELKDPPADFSRDRPTERPARTAQACFNHPAREDGFTPKGCLTTPLPPETVSALSAPIADQRVLPVTFSAPPPSPGTD